MLVSIIIPAYNSSEFIKEAIDSVASQTVNDWELIIIDDGSTDSTSDISTLAAANDSRIRVIRTPNRGVSSARNTGIDHAEGDFISFLDADDILSPHFLESMLRVHDMTGKDIISAEMRKFRTTVPSSLSSKTSDKALPRIKTFSTHEALLALLYQNTIDCSPWGKLYKSSLFRNLRFREGIRYEDLDLIPLIIETSNGVAFLPVSLYLYRQHSDSFLHIFDIQRTDVLNVTRNLELHFSYDPTLARAARSRRLSANFNILGLLAANSSDKRWKAVADECWLTIKKLRRESLFNGNVRIKNKTGILACYIGGRRMVEFLSLFIYG